MDTGIGIKPEDFHKLFSEFERIEEKRNRNIEGTGLGMNITKQLLEMMGSSLMVNSDYGKGSVFSFRLKQKVVNWKPMGDFRESVHLSLSGREKYREKFTAPDAVVLVVDDTEMNLEVFKSLLKKTRIQIETAMSGIKALSMAGTGKYDIIFLDYMMPEMDGVETLHLLKSDMNSPNAETVTVCLTADAISGAREKYLSEGFDDYLTKPIDANRLEEMLIQYLPAEKIREADDDPVNPDTGTEAGASREKKWYDSVPGLDPETAVKNSGSEDAFLSVLKIYYESFEAKYSEIRDFYDAGDWENYTIKVHALKSSSRIVGLSRLGDDAEALEMAGKNSDIDYIKNHHDELMAEYRAVKDALSSGMGVKDDLPAIPKEVLSDAYSALAEVSEVMDYDTARMVMDSVKAYTLPEEDAERFERLQAMLSKMDWNGILEIIKEVL